MIPVVRFTSLTDFITDLTADRSRVDSGIVRANGVWTPSSGMPIVHVSFVATARVMFDCPSGYIYKLEQYLGEHMPDTPGADDRQDKLAALIKVTSDFLETACQEIGLELRRTGVIWVKTDVIQVRG